MWPVLLNFEELSVIDPVDSGSSALHPYSAGSTEAQLLARDYAELVADF